MATDPEYLTLQRETGSWTFWVFSGLAHVLVGVILLYTPAKDFILAKPKAKKRAPMRIRGKKLEKFVEKLRDQTCEELRGRVALLKQGQERMADNFNTMHKLLFKDFDEIQRKTARARLEKYLNETLARSTAFHATCNQAAKAKVATDMVARYPKDTAQILAGLEEIGRGLRLIKDLNALIPAQVKCLDTQYEALKFHRYLEDVVLRQRQSEKDLPRLRAEVKQNHAAIAKHQQSIVEKQQQKTIKKQERAAARKAAIAAGKAKDKKAVRAAKQLGKKRAREIDQISAAIRSIKNSIGKYKRANEKKIAEIAKLEKSKPQLVTRYAEMMDVAKNIQGGTHWQLKKIVEQARAYFKDGTVPSSATPDKPVPVTNKEPATKQDTKAK